MCFKILRKRKSVNLFYRMLNVCMLVIVGIKPCCNTFKTLIFTTFELVFSD